MERLATVQIPLPDWNELWLHTAVMLGIDCLVEQREHVNQIKYGVERVLLVKVNMCLASITCKCRRQTKSYLCDYLSTQSSDAPLSLLLTMQWLPILLIILLCLSSTMKQQLHISVTLGIS